MAIEIISFESNRGEKYVEEFIKNQNPKTVAKIIHTVDLLAIYGHRLGMPHSKKISSELFELRIRGTVEVRIFYCYKKNTIHLLHAFAKKSQKTPIKEIETASNRLREINT